MRATMADMAKHSAPLRLAETPDRITVLAGAIRAFAETPGSPDARRELDTAMLGCTSEEYEAALELAQPGGVPEQAPAAPRAEAADTPSPKPGSRPFRDTLAVLAKLLRAVSGDTVITWAMTATVAVVAVDAAIVSYSHIYALATGSPGSGVETGIQPRLLPLSIDGVIAEASLVLLFAARHKLDAPRLARFMLAFGIAATVAANVVHGLPSSLLPPVAHVVISAFLSAWPAGAFIGSVEMAMQLVRATRDVADTEQDNSADTGADSVSDSPADKRADSAPDRRADKPRDTVRDTGRDSAAAPRGTRTAPQPAAKTTAPPDKVAVAIKRHPRWDDDKIAAECGVHPRTVRRRRGVLQKAAETARVGAA
jgi:Protein of unknown function (DUF2637)